jgi:membrane fusion protein (multidrug efflux system)
VAALFPNPDRLLRPGQFARVRALLGVVRGALLIPRKAVAELQGVDQVDVIDGGNKAHIRSVELGEDIGDLCVVRSGLHPGDRIVVDGIQKVREGSVVNVVQ